MKGRLWLFVLCLILPVPTACSSTKIGYDYAPGTNFHAYHTYEWMVAEQEKTGNRRADSSDIDIRIRTAIAAQLLRKGYGRPSGEEPDFYVAYHVVVNNMTADSSTQYLSDGMAGYPFVRSADTRTMGKGREPANQPVTYSAGTLMIDIIDGGSKKLVWRGTAAGELDPGLTSRERDERIRNIARDILSHFPPKQ